MENRIQRGNVFEFLNKINEDGGIQDNSPLLRTCRERSDFTDIDNKLKGINKETLETKEEIHKLRLQLEDI